MKRTLLLAAFAYAISVQTGFAHTGSHANLDSAELGSHVATSTSHLAIIFLGVVAITGALLLSLRLAVVKTKFQSQ